MQMRLILEEVGGGPLGASISLDSGRVEMLARDLGAAERELRRDYNTLTAMGEKYLRSTIGGLLARVVEMQGRHDEAIEMTQQVQQIAAEDDVDAQALWRGARARALANLGQGEAALALAEEAIALRRRSDSPVHQAEALIDLAEVRSLSGDVAAATGALEEALALAERKGDTVTSGWLRQQLEL